MTDSRSDAVGGETLTNDILNSIAWSGFRSQVRDLPDSEWISLLRRSAQVARDGHKTRWLGWPAESFQRTMHHTSYEDAVEESWAFYRYVRTTLEELGRSEIGSLLDFGSGWGRMIRPFLRDVCATKIVALEPNEHFVRLARELNTQYPTIETSALPPAFLGSSSFELVTSYSVFTHLPRGLAQAWLMELGRILAPGGLAFITIRGQRFKTQLMDWVSQDSRGGSLNEYPRRVVQALKEQFGTDVAPDLVETDYFYIPTNRPGASLQTYGDTLMSGDFLSRLLPSSLALVGLDSAALAQDVAVLVKVGT